MVGDKKMQDIIIWCADIGSISKNRFGWCRGTTQANSSLVTGSSIQDFAEGIAKDLSKGYKIALGFECPLFVPVTDNPQNLTSSRKGEGDRPWSAGAGCGALATGLTETAWILNKIRELTETEINVTLSWEEFMSKSFNLFIWEAFVSKSSKVSTHSGDAEVAVKAFISHYPYIVQANAVTVENPYNLIGGALLRTKLTSDIGMLSQACVVIKAGECK